MMLREKPGGDLEDFHSVRLYITSPFMQVLIRIKSRIQEDTLVIPVRSNDRRTTGQ